jgi:hypothetical protein
VSSAGGNTIHDGRFAGGPADIYMVPYNNRQGGTAKPLQGASDPNRTEYYPAFSPDDRLIAFTAFAGNDVAYGSGGSVNASAEVFVVASQGGAAQRLAANDPPACWTAVEGNIRSPGITNDWPQWSPHVTTANGKSYYWLTFSSKASGQPQLFVTGIIADSSGTLSMTPAGGNSIAVSAIVRVDLRPNFQLLGAALGRGTHDRQGAFCPNRLQSAAGRKRGHEKTHLLRGITHTDIGGAERPRRDFLGGAQMNRVE